MINSQLHMSGGFNDGIIFDLQLTAKTNAQRSDSRTYFTHHINVTDNMVVSSFLLNLFDFITHIL